MLTKRSKFRLHYFPGELHLPKTHYHNTASFLITTLAVEYDFLQHFLFINKILEKNCTVSDLISDIAVKKTEILDRRSQPSGIPLLA